MAARRLACHLRSPVHKICIKSEILTNTKGDGTMKKEQLNQLLYEALETEMGGVQVYEAAIQCATNSELKEEWQEYLEQTKKHEQIVRGVVEKFGLDPEAETPGRKVVRHIGESLVKAMEMAHQAGKPEAAQIVAAECVVEAETKDHLNWSLISEVVKK